MNIKYINNMKIYNLKYEFLKELDSNSKYNYYGFSGIIEYPNGNTTWYLDGRKHREDGPAIQHKFYPCRWYYKGKLHRIGGPAIEEGTHTNAEYYIHGERFTKENYYLFIDLMKLRGLL